MDANKVRLLVTNVPTITKRIPLANLPVSCFKKLILILAIALDVTRLTIENYVLGLGCCTIALCCRLKWWYSQTGLQLWINLRE